MYAISYTTKVLNKLLKSSVIILSKYSPIYTHNLLDSEKEHLNIFKDIL